MMGRWRGWRREERGLTVGVEDDRLERGGHSVDLLFGQQESFVGRVSFGM